MHIYSVSTYIEHYGTKRHSGRYPWGTSGWGAGDDGKSPKYSEYLRLRKEGVSDKEIADSWGVTVTRLRAEKAIAKEMQDAHLAAQAVKLRDKGMSSREVAARMGVPETTVRRHYARADAEQAGRTVAITDALKESLAETGMVDVGLGVSRHMGISEVKLKHALVAMEMEGYKIQNAYVDQVTGRGKTTLKVLTNPDVTYGQVMQNRDKVKIPGHFTNDGVVFHKPQKPLSISQDRVDVVWAEQGGTGRDGLIEIRPGVRDLDIGSNHYAQARVLINGTHYAKGMVLYNNALPEGVDIRVHSNKSRSDNKMDALKPIKSDEDNPFGSVTRQLVDDKGRVRSGINLVKSEGDWADGTQSLAAQMLSKQSTDLAARQLGLDHDRRMQHLDEIKQLTNPVVKKQLLEDFAESADSAAADLKAAALPRQAWHVILPFPGMKEGEVYAPNYQDGEKVALVRYPHAGTFEIAELTVNNKYSPAKKLLGDARDAIGVHPSAAEKMSGADFDGDTVIVIPNNKGDVKASPSLKALEGFDPKRLYSLPSEKNPDGSYVVPGMTDKQKQREMGYASNLITDMTLRGAPDDHIARAVKYSMVVIDAEKHRLDYKQAALDNGISALYKEYQGRSAGGGNTLISRGRGEGRYPERRLARVNEGGPIDKETGKLRYVDTGAVDYKGRLVTTKQRRLAYVEDAHSLSTGHPMEKIYADYSNSVKALANEARREMVTTPNLKYSPTAKKHYAEEVRRLDAALAIAKANAPLERRAQILAQSEIAAKKQEHPDMDWGSSRKLSAAALNRSREATGAKKTRINITEREWEAIQAGAVSGTKLAEILNNADPQQVKQLARPRERTKLVPALQSRAAAMLALGIPQADIAEALGVSPATISDFSRNGE